MDKTKISKTAALALAAVIIIVSLFSVDDWASVGIYGHCPIANRAIYPLFHVGIVHAALNAWCLLSVVFIYRSSPMLIATAYCAAVSIPDCLLGCVPTVGLSGMVFFLFGSITFRVRRKLYYQAWMLFYLAVGFFFPNTNAWVHIYCYAVGVAVALLNRPFKRPVSS